MATSVTVLMGGWSSEREVSLVSGENIAQALAEGGYDVRTVDLQHDILTLIQALTPPPDVVFNALHGRFGEDGTVQGLLELLGVPYTHSGVLASALAMDKPMAKRLFTEAGIRCAEHVVASREDALAGAVMDPPYVIKPLNEGSSVGVKIVLQPDDAADGDAGEEAFGEVVMVERYVRGREITVAVLGDRALGVTEIRPRDGFYDYSAKYTEGLSDHLVPAPMPAEPYDEAMRYAVLAHRTLGCRGVTRADMRYDDTAGEPGEVVLLEINTQPGMTPMSLVPELASHAGIEFTELVGWMVENAACDG
jgi:D-alanine-D-alanine ligase